MHMHLSRWPWPLAADCGIMLESRLLIGGQNGSGMYPQEFEETTISVRGSVARIHVRQYSQH